MITMTGKYNKANIMVDQIDDTAREQIQTFLNHPAFGGSYIAIMPDVHAGKGAVIGFTMTINDYIIPNIIGVDIGCGMMTSVYNIYNVDLPSLDSYIKKSIPSGCSINDTPDGRLLTGSLLDESKYWCKIIGMEHDKAVRSVGSLGGGNHFIEAGIMADGLLAITIHSGSRNFGLRVANHYQAIAKNNLKKYFIDDEYRNLEFLLTSEDDGKNYIKALTFAQEYADINRRTMMMRISEHLGAAPERTIVSVHNFLEDGIIRKGATPANEGQEVIIPFNMRDGLAICRGKGSSKYNFSAPHGAGRILSRTKARQLLSEDTFKRQMSEAGIYTTTANASTIDESPDAYKDMQTILDNIGDTVDVVETIKPIYNYKAQNDNERMDIHANMGNVRSYLNATAVSIGL